MLTFHVHLEFVEPVLGTASSDPEIHERFIASKAPDAKSLAEEVAAVGVEAVEDRSTTAFPRTADGEPMMWDYQVKGFFKDAARMLRYDAGSASKKLTAYKTRIDGTIFPTPRQIVLHLPDGAEIGNCQRPLRAQTAQGERVALANSEELPAGTWCDFDVTSLSDESSMRKCLLEWLQYGYLRGIGQWRNSGKGRFACVVTDAEGEVLLDTVSIAGAKA